MLSVIARLMLTASAIAPVGFIYAFVAWKQDQQATAIWTAAVSVLAVLSCLFVLGFAQRHVERTPFKANAIEAADRENIGFMLLYLLPLFTSKIETLNWELWIPVLMVFAIVTATGYSYHFNPLLGMLQWHFYKVTSQEGVTYILITRKHLRTAAKPLTVGQLTEYMLIDLGEEK